ncbi:MAG: hypothetical protein EA384_04340 [Spirochaetaceae bacterium]|nr:MAG: hypothetical protein EA384_04340 [Spirochaetaceae bacterium]
MISIDGQDVVALYVLLRKNELELDNRMAALYERLARQLHGRLSIEQMENIETIYEQGTDLFE